MEATAPTPDEVQRAGLMAMQVLRGRSLGLIRINPRLAALHRSVSELLTEVRRIDPRGYSSEDFANVIGVLNDAADGFRGFYSLYGTSGDFEFIKEAAQEVEAARRAVVQGLAPDPALRPSDEERHRRIQESTQALYESLISETRHTSLAGR